MLTAGAAQGDKGQGIHKVPETEPTTWHPKEIVYSRYSLEMKSSGELRLTSNPSNVIFSKPGPDSQDFDDITDEELKTIISKLLDDRWPAWTSARPTPVRDHSSALDLIACDRQCYMIVQLDPTIRWRFRTGKFGALTTKTPDPETPNEVKNTKLRHESKRGEPCRLICFRVAHRDRFERCFVNVHVELLQDGPHADPIEIIIDPDVPNTGGELPFVRRPGDLTPEDDRTAGATRAAQA